MYRFLAHLWLIVALGLVVRIAGATSSLGREEANFLRDLFAHSHGEVVLARFVQEQPDTLTVREFVDRIIRDHTELRATITTVAKERGLELPTELTPESRAARSELESKRGKVLEQAYMRRMLQEHRTMMMRLEEQSRNARDEAVREIAHIALSRAREHLALAQRWDPSLSPAPPPAVRTMPGGDR